ncbi:hypothetical protein GCM10010389_65140 [Streptomyces echinoruber]|uniref:Uncharacterized protein n=1 Tax=Streptomyces echinoruber TaxID=68898 RepID=A0A918VPU0_9ACTN|nr:hypothetical protein GCM10010389_65140 [Streptomyces echinoruber]
MGKAGLYETDRGGETPPNVDDEAIPQLGGVRVPQHVGCVVVAVAAERLADNGRLRGVNVTATEGMAVVAGSAGPAGTAELPGTMDGTEGRGGQGDEEPGPVPDGGRDVLTAQEAGADEVVGVSGVEAGTGRTDGGASVAAADEESFAGFVAGVVVVEDFAGCAVQGGGEAGQVDGVGTAAGGGDLLQPARELRILGEADGVAVCFGEPTQARRAIEGGAPVSRSGCRGDGGDLPG